MLWSLLNKNKNDTEQQRFEPGSIQATFQYSIYWAIPLTVSEVAADLGFELSDLNFICCHVFLASICLYSGKFISNSYVSRYSEQLLK